MASSSRAVRCAFKSVSGARSSHSLLIHRRFCPCRTRPGLKPSRLQLHSAPMRTTGAHRDGLDNYQYGCGNIRTPMRVWLSEALMRSRNNMESLDDYTYASWRGHSSFDDARNSGTRASSYPRARRLRRLPSQRRFRNWIYATSATRSSCGWSRNGRRCGVDRRQPNDNQTLVSAGRSPPAAYCRCSHIDVWISADP